MQTPFTQLVGCSVPIQQAPMGPVSSPDLVVAVADAGAVGSMTMMGMSPEAVARRLDALRARTDGVLAANFLTEDVDERAVAAAAERVRLVDFFWLDPRPQLVELVHQAGALASWQVGSLHEACDAVDAGCDLLTVQGTEAGGHVRGRQPLLQLLREVLDAVDVPVLAAGGIADFASLAAVLAAGAAGARIGTRFIATTESGAHPAYKQALVDTQDDATQITAAFNLCPLCATSPRARVLNSAVEAVGSADDPVGTLDSGRGPIPLPRGAGVPPSDAVHGRVEAMALYAGTGVGAVTGIRPAAEVITELMADVGARA
ncbi:NAD(P)H-dependent flavin oxidoreductase [Geodermatophilus sp. URMC 64]